MVRLVQIPELYDNLNNSFESLENLGDLYPVNKKSKMEPPSSPSQSPEVTERLGGESGLRCDKCNISFKKLETYKVHKESYCESRHANVEAIQAARAEKQREREEMKLVNKVRTWTRKLCNP